MSTPPADLKVLIVGAGITGLLIAQGLKKHGIAYSIYEREESATLYRPREWGMSIHWSKPLLVKLLPDDLTAKLIEASVDPSYDSGTTGGYTVPFYNARTGEMIKEMPMPDAIRVSRRKLRALCANGISVEYGKTVQSYDVSESGVSVTFADGSVSKGSVLVGADGAASKVRSLLLGDKGQAKPIDGLSCISVVTKYSDPTPAVALRKIHLVNTAALDPESGACLWNSAQNIVDPEDPLTWQYQLFLSWMGETKVETDDSKRLAQLKDLTAHFAEPWKSLVGNIPEDTPAFDSRLAAWATIPWESQGCLTIAGDAAHAMPPHRGQGLNHSICDAENFVKAMMSVQDGKSVADAISAYNEELVKRGAEEVKTSTMSCVFIHDFEKFTQAPVMQRGYVK